MFRSSLYITAFEAGVSFFDGLAVRTSDASLTHLQVMFNSNSQSINYFYSAHFIIII